MADLTGKVALVTGGSRGIGASVSRLLARSGAFVFVTSRTPTHLVEIEQVILAEGGQCLTVGGDCTRSEDVARVFDVIREQGRGLDILVNNVGGAPRFAGFFELEDEDWAAAYDLNVLSTVRFIRGAVPLLRESSAPRIINMSSISGWQPGTYNPHYTVTKAAILNLSKHLSKALAGDGILVNVVCPGPVVSDSWHQNVEEQARKRGRSVAEVRVSVEREEAAKVPLGRVGTGEDVAGIVAFLASDEAAWITGSAFSVDGGKLQTL